MPQDNALSAASPLAVVAILAAGAAGALIRILLDRVLSPRPKGAAVWAAELGVALVLGACFSAAALAGQDADTWVSSAGSGLTTYAGASGAFAFLRQPTPAPLAILRAMGHLLGCTAVATLGYAVIAVLFTSSHA